MIFIAVGTQKFQFNRLLTAIDVLVSTGGIKEEVFAQIGNSDYVPKHYPYARMMEKAEFDNMISKCDLLITHSGVGTIISGLQRSKPVIVVPRKQKFNEHIDDHQVQIADAFSEQNLVLKCDRVKNILSCINEAKQHKFDRYISRNDAVINEIETFLNDL